MGDYPDFEKRHVNARSIVDFRRPKIPLPDTQDEGYEGSTSEGLYLIQGSSLGLRGADETI